jgi:hypothetical protein
MPNSDVVSTGHTAKLSVHDGGPVFSDRFRSTRLLVSVETVGGTPVEGDAWEAAARTYLDEVSRALEELYRAHGGRTVRLDLFAEERRWGELLYPLSWPGWQRRWARRSKQAQREFVDRIGRAARVYEPVRAEVARRYEEPHAEREAEKRALAEAEELRRQEWARLNAPLCQVADGCSWTYRADLMVSRVDVPTDEAEADRRTPSEPLSTSSLEFVVRDGYLRNRQSGLIEWDPAACAAVERECAALGSPVTFAEWWDTVTVYDWTTDEFRGRLRSHVGRRRRDSGGEHRAFGWYGGDYGTAGHDAGGHSGGFGTTF